MLDTFHINDNSLNNQVFYYNGPTGWQVWNKPPNCNLVNFFLLGGGAGGQGGGIGAASTRNGGAGGGSAAFAYITVPAFALPDTLYILVASGGTGGGTTGGVQGTAGTLSYVCSVPDTSTVNNILMRSGSGNAGATTSATAGAAITAADILLAEAAFISGYAGQTGGAGGVSSGAAPIVVPTGIPITAGAGGAGCSSVGTLGTSAGIEKFGSLTLLDFPYISGGTNTAVAGATAGGGNHGFSTRETFTGQNFRYPMFFTGGAGGGAASNSTGVGGRGGDGQYGCGGGGGGAGGNTTAGRGGDGGHGLVIITYS